MVVWGVGLTVGRTRSSAGSWRLLEISKEVRISPQPVQGKVAAVLLLPSGTLSREVLKVELGITLGKVRGPLAALISRVWDGKPGRPGVEAVLSLRKDCCLRRGWMMSSPTGTYGLWINYLWGPPPPLLCVSEVGVARGASCVG